MLFIYTAMCSQVLPTVASSWHCDYTKYWHDACGSYYNWFFFFPTLAANVVTITLPKTKCHSTEGGCVQQCTTTTTIQEGIGFSQKRLWGCRSMAFFQHLHPYVDSLYYSFTTPAFKCTKLCKQVSYYASQPYKYKTVVASSLNSNCGLFVVL